jgi:hypothetical protein
MSIIAERIFNFTDPAGASGRIIIRIHKPAVVEFHGRLTWRSDVEVSNGDTIVETWLGYGADSLQALETAVVLFRGEWPVFQKHNVGTWEEIIPDLNPE